MDFSFSLRLSCFLLLYYVFVTLAMLVLYRLTSKEQEKGDLLLVLLWPLYPAIYAYILLFRGNDERP